MPATITIGFNDPIERANGLSVIQRIIDETLIEVERIIDIDENISDEGVRAKLSFEVDIEGGPGGFVVTDKNLQRIRNWAKAETGADVEVVMVIFRER